MSDPTTPKPQNGYWTVTWADPRKPGQKRGRAHMKRFGRCDKVNRSEAMRRWHRWLDKEFPRLKRTGQTVYSIDQLCQDYYATMGKRYIVNGKYTTSITRIRIALDSFRAKYGAEEANETTAGMVALWLEGYIHERLRVAKGRERKPRTKETVNLGLTYIKRMYRWGAKFSKVSAAAAGAVQLVDNIRSDHPEIRKTEGVGTVAWTDVEATKAECEKEIRDAIDVLILTGMRPGECLMMRPCDIEFSGDGTGAAMPVYTPRHHKTKHKDKMRKIVLGPKAWAIIKPLLPHKTDAPVFVCPWTGKGWTDEGKFRAVIQRRAGRAEVDPWTPNQLRHNYATDIESRYGAEYVTALLGHSNDAQQRAYIERSLKKAMEVAKAVG